MTLSGTNLSVIRDGRPILDDVSVRMSAPGFVGIIGPNGAGKSTLVRVLLGLITPDRGTAFLDEADIRRVPRAALARRVAYLPQGQTVHWPLSVARLVALGRLPHLGPLSRFRAEDAAAIRRAMAHANILPFATRGFADLSGGEKARVLLARALAVGAPALVADEPLAALDPGHQLDVMALLADEARRGHLVVAVLHDLTLAARHCDRLLLLDHGRLVADGPPDAVLTPEHLARVYGIRAHIAPGLVVPTARVDP